MLIYLRLLKESFNFAISALVNNKLRTFLSLLGVTIGIFSIIAILAAVDSLKKEIEGSMSGLDNNTLIITKFSFGPTHIPNWKIEQFPHVKYDEYQFLSRNLPSGDVSYVINVPSETIKYEENTVDNVGVGAVTQEYYDIEVLRVEQGRFFNESESNSGAPVIVLGHEIASKLFGAKNPIGENIRLYGRKFNVIGVLQKEGMGLFGNSKDVIVLIPANCVRRIYGDNHAQTFPQIVIKPDRNSDQAEYIATVKQFLRNQRGLKAGDDDNFFINELKGFIEFIENITGVMTKMGSVISLFSILVGGFGIANIMFVSVKERTNQIGIQKSLGAKNRFILYQFLFEAIVLAVIGGLIGIVLVWITTMLLSTLTGDFEFVLSLKNIMIGTVISVIIGLISGIIPAISASKLEPVEAIRTGM